MENFKIDKIRKWKLNWALMYNRENFEKLKFQAISSYTTDVIQPLILLFILYLKCQLIYVAIWTNSVVEFKHPVILNYSSCKKPDLGITNWKFRLCCEKLTHLFLGSYKNEINQGSPILECTSRVRTHKNATLRYARNRIVVDERLSFLEWSSLVKSLLLNFSSTKLFFS